MSGNRPNCVEGQYVLLHGVLESVATTIRRWPHRLRNTYARTQCPVPADYNHDGTLDIAVADSANTVSYLKNIS